MPAELFTHPRRGSRRLMSDDDDVRRARGEISCAECRRLKLKCDKKIPCNSCSRRGCPSICPNGCLSSGQGTRFVLADTLQLHAKIAEMGQRIRQLEDALAIFQSGISNERHPLLRDELLAIKFPPDKSSTPDVGEPPRDNTVDSIDVSGILTIGDQGAKYYGPCAGSEALFLAGAEMDLSAEHDETPTVPVEITRLLKFPFGTEDTTGINLEMIIGHLPSQPRAWSLYEAYMEHASAIFCPLKRDEMVDDFLSPIYKAVKETQGSGSSAIQSISPHRLAVLFLILGLGALVDLTLEPYNTESEIYYQSSCACLSLRSVFDSPETATVQAVALMANYHLWGGKKHTMDSAWTLMSLGAKLAQSIGLHRDGAKFNIDAKTVQRRRILFWELCSSEMFYSLSLGRPPSIRLSYVDCQFPEDDRATLDENDDVRIGLHQWKYEFIKDIIGTVTELTLTAKAPQYQTVLELDRKIREKVLPPHLSGSFTGPKADQCISPLEYMRGYILSQIRSATLLYIHRSFFAQAMLDQPVNPLRSAYAPSFLAAYRCASESIKYSLIIFERYPDLCCRVWGIWTILFPAAIIVGCIVARSPSSSMAPSAFAELGLVCDLFEKGAVQSRRARDGFGFLCKLKEKACKVYSQFRSGNPTSNAILFAENREHAGDELALFGGQTRVLVSKLLSSRSLKGNQSASPSLPVPSVLDNDCNLASPERAPDVHPALTEYLSMFPHEYVHNNTIIPVFGYEDVATSSTFDQPQHNTRENQSTQSRWQPLSSRLTTSATSPQSYSSPQSSSSSFGAPFMTFAPLSEFETTQSKRDTPEEDLDMTADSGVDEHWMSFMRDTGLFNGNLNGSGPYGVGGTMSA